MNIKIVTGVILLLSGSAFIWYLAYALLSDVPSPLIFNSDVIYHMITGANKKPLAKYALTSFLLIVSPVVLYLIYLASNQYQDRFGDARFASIKEMKQYGYFGFEGIIVGQTWYKKMLYSFGPKTIGLVARPRSGKGVSFVITNLLNWKKSALVIDVKKELFKITSGFRKLFGQEIIVFDPFDEQGESHSINIFDNVDRKPANLASEVQEIAYGLMPDGKDSFWDAGGRKIFSGIAMYLLETNQHCSIPSIIAFTEGSENLQDKMLRVIEEYRDELTDYTIGLLSSYAQMDPDNKLVNGYFENFDAHLEVFKSAAVRAATDKSDVRIDDLKQKRKTIYLVVKPKKIESLGRLFGVITNQILFSMTKEDAVQGETGSVMFMLDEFTALGEMKQLKKGAAFLGGYGVRMCIIYQNHAQLESVYGVAGAKEITGLMHERIYFASSDIEEARKVSLELGQRTVKGKSRSYNRTSTSKSVSDAGMDLMSPQKLLRLDEDKELILAAGQRPILCNKLFYYKDERFTERLVGPADGIPKLDVESILAKKNEVVDLNVSQSKFMAEEAVEDFS